MNQQNIMAAKQVSTAPVPGIAGKSGPGASPARIEFNGEDAIFLAWVLGFTAGANLDRDAARGERIFARCRDLHEKIQPIGVNTEVNPS